MTELESKIYQALYEKCELRKWYSVDKSRSDYEVVVESLLNINDRFGCVELNGEKDMYRRVESFEEVRDMCNDLSDQNVGTKEALGSIIISKVDTSMVKINKSLKSKEIEGFKKLIPGKEKLSPIGEKIMADHNSKSEAKRVEEEQRKEKQRKLNEWKNQ